MAGIRSRNTRPEIFIRRLLHRVGYRFRLATKIGKVKPDIVLPKWRTAIFIHGCFWHGHEPCHLYRLPKSRGEFWYAKVEVNKQRDRRVLESIRGEGWNAITLWECALKGRRRLDEFLLKKLLDDAIRGPSSIHEIAGAIDHT